MTQAKSVNSRKTTSVYRVEPAKKRKNEQKWCPAAVAHLARFLKLQTSRCLREIYTCTNKKPLSPSASYYCFCFSEAWPLQSIKHRHFTCNNTRHVENNLDIFIYLSGRHGNRVLQTVTSGEPVCQPLQFRLKYPDSKGNNLLKCHISNTADGTFTTAWWALPPSELANHHPASSLPLVLPCWRVGRPSTSPPVTTSLHRISGSLPLGHCCIIHHRQHPHANLLRSSHCLQLTAASSSWFSSVVYQSSSPSYLLPLYMQGKLTN